jgi:hypothetical protein
VRLAVRPTKRIPACQLFEKETLIAIEDHDIHVAVVMRLTAESGIRSRTSTLAAESVHGRPQYRARLHTGLCQLAERHRVTLQPSLAQATPPINTGAAASRAT